MSLESFLAPLLYPTVGLGLFIAWAFARAWDARGEKKKALAMRAFVVVAACSPMLWTLNLIRESLGWDAVWGHALAFGGCCAFLLLALRLRTELDGGKARRAR